MYSPPPSGPNIFYCFMGIQMGGFHPPPKAKSPHLNAHKTIKYNSYYFVNNREIFQPLKFSSFLKLGLFITFPFKNLHVFKSHTNPYIFRKPCQLWEVIKSKWKNIFNFCKKCLKVHNLYFQKQLKPKVRPGTPHTPLIFLFFLPHNGHEKFENWGIFPKFELSAAIMGRKMKISTIPAYALWRTRISLLVPIFNLSSSIVFSN